MSAVRCDLVIPVYNALRSTRDCLDSVRRFAPPWVRVVVVNDGSDARTTEWLRAREGILLLENPVNLGFIKTANRGLLFSDAPYVCLLNSDTLLTEGALEAMVARMDAEPEIALCCPISNGAVNLSVKVPHGSDVFSFGRRVRRTSPALYPDACTVVGFCLLFRREVIRTLGVFDEIFGRGYCEETDYHYRCRAAGWLCVVADDAFVYHRHEGSFTDRDSRFAKNLEILMARWRRLHERELALFDAKNALGAVRDDSYEWRLAGDAPEPADVLFVLASLEAPATPTVAQLSNALLVGGTTAHVVVLDESGLADSETFFRPLVVPPSRLGADLPAARAVVATDEVAAAALAIAAEGRPELRVGLLEAGPVREALLGRLFCARAGFDPRDGSAELMPLSPEPDLFYPRDGRKEPPVRVASREAFAAPEGVEATVWAGLGREKRAALFGTSHVVLELGDESALTTLEAMAAGAVPVVRRGSSAEPLVRDGETGVLVRDAEEACASVATLASDPERLRRISRAALAEARSRSWRLTADAFLKFLERAAPLAPLDVETRALCKRIVAARPRPAPRPVACPPPTRAGLRARLGRVKRRLLARI